MGLFSGIGKMIGGFAKRGAARRAQRAARAEKDAHTNTLKSLESSRQAVVNPYDSVKDQSGKLSNPFASLGVSTAAADMQAEQTDVALANTLDTIRSTGGGAGGATALAQAALQSKKGVAASIEGQEAANAKLKAQGQQSLERAEVAEGARTQSLEGQGKAFKFNAGERRENDKIQYTRKLRDTAQSRELGAAQAKANAVGDIAGGLGGIADTAFGT